MAKRKVNRHNPGRPAQLTSLRPMALCHRNLGGVWPTVMAIYSP